MSVFVPWRVLDVRERQTERPTGHAIYALVDPRDRLIRYVGYTSRPLEKRLIAHLKYPVNAAMKDWYRELAHALTRPEIKLITWAERSRWETEEMYWIAWCRQLGMLLNVDAGGSYRDQTSLLVKDDKQRCAERIAREIVETIDEDPESSLGTRYLRHL